MNEITPDNQGIGKVSQPSRPKAAPVRGTGVTGAFSKILSDQVLSDMDPGQKAPVPEGGLPELAATYASKQVAPLQTAPSLVAEKISAALDLLDQYAGGLADPATTLKQAFSLLEEISSRTSAINDSLEETGNDDPKIRKIMDHLDTVVALEKIKINRGDYS